MRTLAVTLFAALALALAASAQNSSHYHVTGAAVSSGGATAAAGGHYSLGAVLGQPAPGLSSGADYRLEAGALPAASTVSACGRLTVALVGDSVVVTWATELGCVLETAASLSSTPIWTAVMPQPAGDVFVVPVANSAQFFRLRAP
jgi:hypothetical protein